MQRAVTHTPSLPRRASAEALGAFALVFVGCGAIVTNSERHGALGSVGVSLVFGLVILVGIAAFGHISGAHFNPAVTTSFFLTRHLPGPDAATYIAAQLAGATAAAVLLWIVWPGRPAHLGATVPTIAVSRAAVLEAVMSALLMLVIIERRHRFQGSRGAGRDCDRRDGHRCGPVRRSADRRIDESGPLVRAGARVRTAARLLDLPRRSAAGSAAGRVRLPVRPWRASMTPGSGDAIARGRAIRRVIESFTS